jgi:phosphatidylethanolamine-binding protein (PEBP) family uncharacterized protein
MRDLTFANGGNNYHWVLWDIPSTTTSLPQGVPNEPAPNPPGSGAKQTHWSFGAQVGYGNICPISGPATHEYEITVLSFSVSTVPIGGATGPNEVDAILQANKTSSASLRGKYTKQ